MSMNRYTAILSFCLCLLICLAGQAGGADKQAADKRPPAVIIHNAEQFNRHLDNIALKLQERTLCVFKHEELIHARNITERSVWYDYGNAYKAAIFPQQIAEFTFQYKDNTRLLAAHLTPELATRLSPRERQALQEAQKRVQRLIHPGMTEAQKFRALHDDMVNRGRYTREQMGNVCDLLLEGRGTCEAYSRTLWLLCRMSGLRCHIVYGSAGEPHAWNLVCIDNCWYHTDATWDDPVTQGQPHRQTLSHRYFMLNDTQMSKDHSWTRTHLPVAMDKNAEFFRKNKLYFTEDAPLWAALCVAINRGQGSIEVYMENYLSDASLRHRLMEATYKIPALRAVTSWQGPAPHGQGVVRFTFENAGDPRPADMQNLDFSRGIMVETRRMIDSIDTAELQKQWEQISETALSWWEQLPVWLNDFWQWLVRQIESILHSIDAWA